MHSNYIFVGVHFISELESDSAQEKSATASPVVESRVSVEHCDLIGVLMCVLCTTVGC